MITNYLFFEKIAQRGTFYHVANPIHRDSIRDKGLVPTVGEQRYGDWANNIPAVFATTDLNRLFDSGYDDDVWSIDADGIEWQPDSNFDGHDNPHVVTTAHIKPSRLKLIHKGTGKEI